MVPAETGLGMLFLQFKKFITRHNLFTDKDAVVVAVSGGVDSMVLLDLMCRLSHRMHFKVSVAHVNHLMRGLASDADERLVRRVSKSFGVQCDILRKRPPQGRNLQDGARKIRYTFFKRIAAKRGASVIATAHHLDDQAETILMHLVRGSGLKGLTGMRPISSNGSIDIIRPLLFASRLDIERYAGKMRVAYRDDATNTTTKYARNRVRLRLMPAFKEINPRIVKGLAAMGERFAEDEESLQAFACEAFGQSMIHTYAGEVALRRQAYVGLPSAIRKRVLRLAFEKASGSTVNLNSDQLGRMDGIATGGRKNATYRLPSPWGFFRNGEVLKFVSKVVASRRVIG